MAQPYCQGDLAGLCGIYTVINAVDYRCGPLAKNEAQLLFKTILFHLETKTALANLCTDSGFIKYLAHSHYSMVTRLAFKTPLVEA
jgi:hypothetical protein